MGTVEVKKTAASIESRCLEYPVCILQKNTLFEIMQSFSCHLLSAFSPELQALLMNQLTVKVRVRAVEMLHV